ncbi:cation-translocating P-type ATPase [Roseicyclus sp.]|uniref:cation-translocating P-type ATPase n=1 Tax=Roseicyclus sp. TaxID=1914329 RepID=UPI003F6D2747
MPIIETDRIAAHAMLPDAVAAALDAELSHGLSDDEAAQRQHRFGPNMLRRKRPKGVLSILLHQMESVIVWLLAAAAIFSFLLGDLPEAVAILVVLLINGAIGFFTELKGTRSMEALMRIAEVRSRVRRDGSQRMINARDLVPGDLVVLEPGDVVTADLRLTMGDNLQVDESILTGESVPVIKTTAVCADDPTSPAHANIAYKGTAITQGTGEGLVVATGMSTELGRISALVQSAKGEVAPLEKRLDKLGHRLVWLTLGLALLTIGVGLLRGHAMTEMIQTGVALAVAAVPEGLPVVATLSLARGMWRMSAHNALITRLSSVETLGATTVILTDKTGTLTENRMTAVAYLFEDQRIDLTPNTAGLRFDDGGKPVSPADDPRLLWALRVGALCNTAHLGDGSTEGGLGDPMEQALLRPIAQAGLPETLIQIELPVETVHGFDPVRKMMATTHRDAAGMLSTVKGAPETVLDICSHVMAHDGTITQMTAQARKAWAMHSAEAAQSGLRLLALAKKHHRDATTDPYADLTLIGLVCLRDPIRADVPQAIAASRDAGVRVVMLTGDHADTAHAIAMAAGLGDGALKVIEGSALADLTLDTVSEAQRQDILSADVFARVTPETKMTLVALYQQAGHVVAMTGDGVNDAPALKKADIGIAMGLRGTEVAKEAAHMVLRDDAFSTIIVAMRQGRVIFGNIRNFVVYLMSCNVSEVLVVGLAVAGGLPTPLLPLQILYLNLVTDIFPAFALGFGHGDAHVMTRPPRDPSAPIVTARHWLLLAVLGGAITLATLGAFGLALFWLELDPPAAITVAFLTLALAQMWNVFNLRNAEAGVLRNDVTANPYVWGAIALCLVLIGAALWVPLLADVLSLAWPGSSGLGLAGAASLVPLGLGQIWIGWARRRA